jgi:hypothetical protein
MLKGSAEKGRREESWKSDGRLVEERPFMAAFLSNFRIAL